MVPLPRDSVESVSRFSSGIWLELKQVLASSPNTSNKAGIFEYPKMLRDGLSRKRRVLCETRNREERPVAELYQEGHAGFVAHCSKQGGIPTEFPSHAFTGSS